MNIKLVARYIGVALLFNAAFMFLSVIVSMINGFDSSFSPLLLSCLITTTVGCFPLIFVRNKEEVGLKEGYAITFFSWVLSFVFGMLPYVLWGDPFTLPNAWFESVSGYTTTGSTILSDIEALPKGLLFWRYSTHYIGGIGVMIFMLMVLPAVSAFTLRKIEISTLSKDNYKYKTKQTLVVISSMYIGITIVTFISLILAGMPLFDSLGHSMTIVATGGFSNRNLSIAAYDSHAIEIVSTIFMYISSLHFGLMYAFVVKRSMALLKSPVFRYYTALIIILSVIIAVNLIYSGSAVSWNDALLDASFQVVSIITTTGLASVDTNLWPLFSIMLLVLAMNHGACSGSTTGGLKADRIWVFYYALKRQLVKQLHPNAVVPVKIGNNMINTQMVLSTLIYIVTYFIVAFIGVVVLSFCGVGLVESLSASFSSISNVGPGFGECGSLGNFSEFPSVAKFILTVEMFLGRLEIYVVLVIFQLFKK